jgi:hypothetical protein
LLPSGIFGGSTVLDVLELAATDLIVRTNVLLTDDYRFAVLQLDRFTADVRFGFFGHATIYPIP